MPQLLQYLIPGYIAVHAYMGITSKKYDRSSVLLASCAVSYVSISVISLFAIKWIALQNLWISVLASTLLASSFMVLIAAIVRSDAANCAFVQLFAKNFHDSALSAMLDLNHGTLIKIYLKDSDYFFAGSYYTNDDHYISIHKPVKYRISDGEIIYTQGDNERAYMLFKFDDIAYMESFRGE